MRSYCFRTCILCLLNREEYENINLLENTHMNTVYSALIIPTALAMEYVSIALFIPTDQLQQPSYLVSYMYHMRETRLISRLQLNYVSLIHRLQCS